jgi:ankyrin repeat protein
MGLAQSAGYAEERLTVAALVAEPEGEAGARRTARGRQEGRANEAVAAELARAERAMMQDGFALSEAEKHAAFPQPPLSGVDVAQARRAHREAALRRKSYEEPDASLGELLQLVRVAPCAEGAGPGDVIRSLMPRCGPRYSFHPRVDHLVMRIAAGVEPRQLHTFTDANGDSLLHLAAQRVSAQACAFFVLERGFKPGRPNKRGRTPLHALVAGVCKAFQEQQVQAGGRRDAVLETLAQGWDEAEPQQPSADEDDDAASRRRDQRSGRKSKRKSSPKASPKARSLQPTQAGLPAGKHNRVAAAPAPGAGGDTNNKGRSSSNQRPACRKEWAREPAFAVAEVLLKNGWSAEATDSHGVTPLHLAAAGCDAALVALLLLCGGDPRREDDMGRSPAWYAAACGQAKNVVLLEAETSKAEASAAAAAQTGSAGKQARVAWAGPSPSASPRASARAGSKGLAGHGSPLIRRWRELAWALGAERAAARRRRSMLSVMRELQAQAQRTSDESAAAAAAAAAASSSALKDVAKHQQLDHELAKELKVRLEQELVRRQEAERQLQQLQAALGGRAGGPAS